MTGDIKHWAITDGRVTIGTVDLNAAGAYVARNRDGHVIGTFDNLLLAFRALTDEPVEQQQ
jgi:hypothetical protein